MRRFSGLLVLLFFSLPFSVAVVGCHHAVSPEFCPGFSNSGPVAGQITTITFSGNLTTVGESLNYGQIGSTLSASATDCLGSNIATSGFTFGTSDMSIADINPASGQVCAGTWNRNTGGGVPDYSVCAPPSATPSASVAYVTASAGGATSNPIPIYVHPVVTGVTLGNPTATASCSATSTVTGRTTAGSNVVSAVSNTTGIAVKQGITGAGIPAGTVVTSVAAGTLTLSNNATVTSANGIALILSVADPSSNCCPANASLINGVTPYDGVSCVSQSSQASNGNTRQLVARAFDSNGNNITCQVGHITFSPQSASSVVSIDANGIATANQPGSTTVLASVSNSSSGSSAGFFSTCPPASISLTAAGSATPLGPINVALNNAQALTTTVLDTNGNPLSGLSLQFVSTSPQTLSAGSNTVNPSFPGTATVTATCQPPSCNPSPFSQIGYLGNGKPVTSNGITVSTAGTSSNQVIVASTNSFFFYSVDFTTGSIGAQFKLPYLPNSLVSTQDGSTLYLGSTNVLMSVSTTNGGVSAIGAIPGVVLAVSPDASTLVIADPNRATTSLYSSSGALQTTYAGIGTRAQWTPDSSTVYIAAGNQMLVHSIFTGWTSTPVAPAYQDVAITVPSYGAYFAAGTQTDGRSYCATSVGTAPASPPPAVANTFFPLAETDAVPTQRVAATSDGAHLLGLGVGTAGPNLYDLALTPATSSTDPRIACTRTAAPVTFSSTASTRPLAIPATSTLNGIVPASNSSVAFVTYGPGTAPNGALPFYFPATRTLSSLTLSGTATAPLAGAFSSDNKTFYVTTTGDNALHIVTVNGTTINDSSTIPVNLPAATGTGTVPANLIAQRVRKATS